MESKRMTTKVITTVYEFLQRAVEEWVIEGNKIIRERDDFSKSSG